MGLSIQENDLSPRAHLTLSPTLHYRKTTIVPHTHRTKSAREVKPHSLRNLCFYSQRCMNRVIVRGPLS